MRNILTGNEGEVGKEEEAEAESRLQTSNSKLQRNSKRQASNSDKARQPNPCRAITRTCLRAEATARWAGTCLRSKAATARQARRLGREREQDLDVR